MIKVALGPLDCALGESRHRLRLGSLAVNGALNVELTHLPWC